jgi:hypothetical protein
MSERLRYTGVQATTFLDAGHVEPGGEFEVSDEAAERYLRRSDVESASGKPRGSKRGSVPSAQEAQGEPPVPDPELSRMAPRRTASAFAAASRRSSAAICSRDLIGMNTVGLQ